MSIRYIILLAASPLALSAGAAQAAVSTTSAVTTPVATATAASGAPDDVDIASGGSVKPASGSAVTLNSDNSVSIEGAAGVTDADGAVGVAIQGGRTGEFRSSGTITVDESYLASDTNGDGILDGPFAKGTGRFGVRLTGSQPFQGTIATTGGAISVKGNDSAGISLETTLLGDLQSGGSIGVMGDRSFGVRTTAPVAGSVVITGAAVSVSGAGAVGVAIHGDVGGALRIDQPVSATGYRLTARPVESVIAKMTADELQIGGPAAIVGANVAGGVLVAAAPTTIDPNVVDANKDGMADASEGPGSLTSYGSAPALVIGDAARTVRLGTLNPDLPYGLAILGNAQGLGVYDGVAATGVQVGGLGGGVTVDGGIFASGLVSATTVKANAIGLRIGGDVSAPSLAIGGGVSASANSAVPVSVHAIQIDSGAQVSSLVNVGGVLATITTGSVGEAVAVQDLAGGLTSITNLNAIKAVITPSDGSAPTGSRVALDLRANTQGLTLTQSANASAAITPSIVGDVLFGTGAAHVAILAGSVTGGLAFGGGASTLAVDGGASVTGPISQSGGSLAVSVASGALADTGVAPLNLASLYVGPGANLIMTLDAKAAAATQFNVAGPAVIASGAQLGVRLATKLVDPATFTLIRASSLSAPSFSQIQLGSTPYLDVVTLRADPAQNAVLADVRRRTTAELGLNASESGAYDAVFANFDNDAAVRDALLSKTDRAGFDRLYDQLLPDHAGGVFETMAAAHTSIGRALDGGSLAQTENGYRVWTQEVGFVLDRTADLASNYRASGFGLTGGFETPSSSLGAVGVQTSFVAVDVREKARPAESNLSGSEFSAGGYWRAGGDNLIADLSATGGYARMKESRAVSDPANSLQRLAQSRWSGLSADLHADLGYRAYFGHLYVEPELTADCFILREGGHSEHGGGASVDAAIDRRTSSERSGFVGAAVGARFDGDGDFQWMPELTAGWRQIAGKGVADTKGHFLAGGPDFNIAGPKPAGGEAVVRAAIRGRSQYVDFALEGGGEFNAAYRAYDARVLARWPF